MKKLLLQVEGIPLDKLDMSQMVSMGMLILAIIIILVFYTYRKDLIYKELMSKFIDKFTK